MNLILALTSIRLLFLLNMNGSGGFISDGTIVGSIVYLIVVHVACVSAYVQKTGWLRLLCGILYLPVFLILFVMTAFDGGFIVLLIPAILFYTFTIIRTRK